MTFRAGGCWRAPGELWHNIFFVFCFVFFFHGMALYQPQINSINKKLTFSSSLSSNYKSLYQLTTDKLILINSYSKNLIKHTSNTQNVHNLNFATKSSHSSHHREQILVLFLITDSVLLISFLFVRFCKLSQKVLRLQISRTGRFSFKLWLCQCVFLILVLLPDKCVTHSLWHELIQVEGNRMIKCN